MRSWNDYIMICMHGVPEELDYHPCKCCQLIAKGLGYSFGNNETYIFTSQQQVDKLEKEAGKK